MKEVLQISGKRMQESVNPIDQLVFQKKIRLLRVLLMNKQKTTPQMQKPPFELKSYIYNY